MSDEKYPFFDVPEDDVSPLFTTKLQEAARVGCLRSVFDSSGIATDWIKGNESLRSPAFKAELDIDTHQTGKYPEAVLEQAVRAVFDLTPAGMISALGLNRPIFAQFCNYGHFTHQDAPWEQTDRTAALVSACGR